MSFNPLNSLSATGNLMDLIAKKQKAIGSNLANMDTPGYVRKDVNFGEYLATTGSALETSLSAKMGPSPISEERSYEDINPTNELMELQKNSLLYTMATRRMSNVITQMRTVINVGK